MAYTAAKTLEQKELEPIEGMEQEENKDAKEDDMNFEETVIVQIEILDLSDMKDHVGHSCVEFTRKSGSSTLFYEQWQMLEEKLQSYNTVQL